MQKNFTETLIKAFPVEDRTAGHLEKRGYRILVITGMLYRTIDIDFLIEKIRAVLPADANICDWDGQLFRINQTWPAGHLSDAINLVFSSSTWPEIEEGALIPRLEPLFYQKAPPAEDSSAGTFPRSLHLPVLEPGDSYELVVSKKDFRFEIPRDRETDDQVVIVVRPR